MKGLTDRPRRFSSFRLLISTGLAPLLLFASGPVGGTPRFPNPVYPVGSVPSSVVAVDFNCDGKADLACPNGGGVALLEDDGDGLFHRPEAYPLAGRNLVSLGESTEDTFVPLSDAMASTSGSKANIKLVKQSALLTQTTETAWTLEKTGAVSAPTSTVTWSIVATEGATTAGHLSAQGVITVSNSGTGGATIGNIVVALQTKNAQNKWETRCADVADATSDDAATSAHVVASVTSENLGT